MRIYLTGRTRTAIVFTGARVRFAHRAEPLAGSYMQCSRGGAAVNPRHVAVDLDRGTARLDRGDANRPFLFSLREGGTEVFDITAFAERCDCSWWLELNYLQDGHPRTLSVGDRSSPFRTTGKGRARPVRWVRGAWQT